MNQSQGTHSPSSVAPLTDRAAERDQAREVLDALFSSSEFFRRDVSYALPLPPPEPMTRREASF